MSRRQPPKKDEPKKAGKSQFSAPGQGEFEAHYSGTAVGALRMPSAENQLSTTVRNQNPSFREAIDPNGYLPEIFFDGLQLDATGTPLLYEFDLNIIPLDATVVNFGMRRTGKSVLARHILWHLRNEYHRGVVMSDTDKLNQFYHQHFPPNRIIDHLDQAILKNILLLQERFIKVLNMRYGNAQKVPDEEWRDVRVLLLFDDVIQDDNAVRYNPPLNQVFVAGRHFKTFFLMNTQYEKAIPPKMRNNVDVAFMFYHENLDAIEHLWRLFGNTLDRHHFTKIFNKYTQDHMTLVSARSTITSPRLIDRLWWFKADISLENVEFELGENQRGTSVRDSQFDPALEG